MYNNLSEREIELITKAFNEGLMFRQRQISGNQEGTGVEYLQKYIKEIKKEVYTISNGNRMENGAYVGGLIIK